MNISKQQLNEAVRRLEQVDRPQAVAILADVGDGALNTVKLKPELWQPVFEACEAALKKLESASS